jgi:acetylglutamate kinase
MIDPELREEFARDVVLLKYVGLDPIVVHGGGPEITSYMERLGMPVEFVGGLRVSDAPTVEIAKMVLVGKVNKDIVGRLNRHGQAAVGLSGDDGRLFSASRMAAPPYLITTVLPWNSRMYGSASSSVAMRVLRGSSVITSCSPR